MNKRDILIVTILSVLSLAYFFNRGFAYYDEGYILHSAQRIVQGDIPYKDFEFIYTPGTILLVAAFFKLFGESILIERLLVVAVAILTSLLIFKILNCHFDRSGESSFKKIPRLQKSSLGMTSGQLFAYLAVLIYLSWFPTHTNFPWPVVFAFPVGLLVSYFLFKEKPFLAGVMTFVAFFFKQNFGAAVLLSCLIYLLILKRSLKIYLTYLLSLCVGILLFIIYLLLTNSFVPFISYLLLSSFKIAFQGALATGFPSGMKSLIYLFPGLISLVAFAVSWVKNKKLVIFPLFTLLFYLFGIRPTTDYVHLAPLMGVIGIPFTIILVGGRRGRDPDSAHEGKVGSKKISSLSQRALAVPLSGMTESTKIIIYIVLLLLIILGFYTALFKNYYRWDSPLIEQTYYINNPRAEIFVDKKFSQVIPEILTTINEKTKKDDYIFSYFYAPMFYFLADRRNPSRFISLAENSLTANQERQLITRLEKEKVRLIITHQKEAEWSKSLVYAYIKKDFKKTKEIFEFAVWQKK